MNKTIDFKWLSEKTSPEFVAAVKETVDKTLKREVILNTRIEEIKFNDVSIHCIAVYILATDVCHHLIYHVDREYFTHYKMFRSVISTFMELEAEHLDHLTEKVNAL